MPFVPSRRRLMSATMLAACAGLAPALPATALAQEAWPTQPVKVIVGYPAGTSPDMVARAVAEPLAQLLGQPVVIENRPGAGGNIGVQAVVASKDTHTFGFTTNGPLTTAKELYSKLGYDPAKDVQPISLAATSPLVLILNADAPPKNLRDFIAWAKATPTAVSYGSIGQGSGSHLTMELFAARAGVKMLHVPYQGFPQVTNAILGQQINAAFMAPSGALTQVKTGKVRVLGVSSPQPTPLAPDVPTIAAAGLPGFQTELWVAAFGAATLPPPIAARLARDIGAILQRPDVREKLLAQGWQAVGSTPEGLAQRIREDTAVWSQVIRQAGVKVE